MSCGLGPEGRPRHRAGRLRSRGDDHSVRLGDDRHVGDVVLVRARAEASEDRARSAEIGADEETERTRALGAAERTAERDRLGDARMTAELLDVPASDETAEAVTDEVDAASHGDLRDESREATCDAVDARAGSVREARDLRLRVVHEVAAHRAEHAGAREEPVNQHDHVVARRDLRRHDGRDVARHEHDLAKRRDGLGHARAKRPGEVVE